MSDKIVGWDIGGAHLKVAVLNREGSVEFAAQRACPLWLGVSRLHQAFQELLAELPGRSGAHAVTMTGELVDLFADRDEGVREIVGAVGEILPKQAVRVYAGVSGFLTVEDIGRAHVEAIASANWLASASYCSRRVDSGLFVDIGSTTTDILTLHQHGVRAKGYTDFERLKSGELLYMGIVRTPVIAIAQVAPFEGEWVGLMAEHFATTADVFRMCGDLPAHADQTPAADGGEKTPDGSRRRLARMLGRDANAATPESWARLAGYLRERQMFLFQKACYRQLSREVICGNAPFVGAGVGRFVVADLAKRFDRPYVDFDELIPTENRGVAARAADCAPAVSVAALLAHEI